MQIIRAYKTELDPTDKQRTAFLQCAGTSRFVFNWGLATWQQWYEDGKKPSAYSLRKHFNAIKAEQCPWIYDIPYAVTEASFQNLDAAFKNFFRRVKQGDDKAGYPKFKRRSGNKSFQLKSTRIEHGQVRLTHIGWVRLKEHGYIPCSDRGIKFGTYATVSERAGRWYISVLTKETVADPTNDSVLTVGIDFGLKTLAVLSNGETFPNPHALIVAEQKLSRLQRELSRRKRGGANWQKTKAKVARLYAKIANIRKHTLHDISHHVTADLRPRAIVIEDLNVSGMMSNRHLSKAVSDVGFYELRRQIEYKAQRLGIEVIIADRWYASSKTCSGCGWKNTELTLSDRVFHCPECGLEIDRDLNAALNLQSLAA